MKQYESPEWMGRGWWIALGAAIILIVMTHNGKVGAPAQAASRLDATPTSVSRSGSKRATIASELPRMRQEIELAERLRTVSAELAAARAALEIERERSSVLESSYASLDEQFETVTQMLRSDDPAASADAIPAVPVPVEAVFVRETNH